MWRRQPEEALRQAATQHTTGIAIPQRVVSRGRWVEAFCRCSSDGNARSLYEEANCESLVVNAGTVAVGLCIRVQVIASMRDDQMTGSNESTRPDISCMK